MADQRSKAKYLRELLDNALVLKVPALSPEEFDRIFGLRLLPEEIRDVTFAEVIARQLVMKAAMGNDRSITDIFERLLGKPLQTTETVSKSYNYYDFLVECREADAREVVTTTARELPAPPSADEVLAELL